MKHFIVEDKFVKWRLDKFLTEKMGETRSQIKKQIEAGLVLINDKPAKVHQFLNLKDVIEIQNPTPHLMRGKTQNPNDENLAKEKIVFPIINIIKKTPEYLIIEKPSGLLVHPTHENEQNTLVNWLVVKFPEIAKLGDTVSLSRKDKTFRPGIVHRLDREVSGLMLIPRTQDAFDYYKEQFKKRLVQKEYTALVIDDLPKDQGLIEFRIGRISSGGKMAAHAKNSPLGKPALTEYFVEKRFRKYTLVKINLLTGRTNQIRVHFLALGYPVVGDPVYQIKSLHDKSNLPRVFLHASHIAFTDRNGEKQSYASALPDELQTFLNRLK